MRTVRIVYAKIFLCVLALTLSACETGAPGEFHFGRPVFQARAAAAEAPVFSFFPDASQLDVAYIKDGALVTNFNHLNEKGVVARYTGVDLGEAPTEVKCKARFYGGGAVAIVTTPSEEWSLAGITSRSIHAVFTSESYHFGFYENGVLVDVLADAYTLDTSGEKEYTFGFTISRSTITFLLPTGKKVKKVDDDRVKTCNGQRVIFEHYLTAEDVAGGSQAAITYCYAKGPKLKALKDTFERADGLPMEAPSGHLYVQFRNE